MPVGNGEPMKIDQVPFQLQIRDADRATNALAPGIANPAAPRWQTRHICGGTLIDRDWVPTAAHGVGPAHVKAGIAAQLGAADISGGDGVAVPVDRVVRHARYAPGNIYDYDIALLHLARGTTAPIDSSRPCWRQLVRAADEPPPPPSLSSSFR